MKKVGRDNQAEIECVLGATGTGKTTYVMKEVRRKKPSRLMVWDKKGEFGREGFGIPVYSMTELVGIVGAAKNNGFKVAYKPPRCSDKDLKKQFDLFCRIAFVSKRLTVVAEELADVTLPNWATPGWRELTSQGRTEGVSIYGLSQLPASIDKMFFSNATLIRGGRVNFDDHVKTLARALKVPVAEVDGLTGHQWISRNLHTGELMRGS